MTSTQHRHSLTLKPGVTHYASGPWALGIVFNPVAASCAWGPSCCFRALHLQKSVLWNQVCGLCFSQSSGGMSFPRHCQRSFPHSLSFLLWYHLTVRPFPITLYKITPSPRIHPIPLLPFCHKPFCTIWHFKHLLVFFFVLPLSLHYNISSMKGFSLFCWLLFLTISILLNTWEINDWGLKQNF